jgi:hypothetical protein
VIYSKLRFSPSHAGDILKTKIIPLPGIGDILKTKVLPLLGRWYTQN